MMCDSRFKNLTEKLGKIFPDIYLGPSKNLAISLMLQLYQVLHPRESADLSSPTYYTVTSDRVSVDSYIDHFVNLLTGDFDMNIH